MICPMKPVYKTDEWKDNLSMFEMAARNAGPMQARRRKGVAMNARENYLALINHEETERVPGLFTDVNMLGGQLEYWENGPAGGGLDGFGCGWIGTASAGGQPALDPTFVVCEDVCDWEDKVTFPNPDDIDWEAYAAPQLAMVDRENKFVEYHMWNSVFLRYTHLLGFENALCAFYEEPDAVHALLEALTDYKIRMLERIAKYFKPDAYVHYDDVATERSLFMSPEVYREFIKPVHKRMNDAAEAMGIIPLVHVCGKCESIIEDLIDEGSRAWQAAQPQNDIAGIIERYGDRFSVIGGYDSQGRAGAPDVTDEEIIAEVDRCFDEYGRFGRGYGFFGFFLGSMADPETMRKFGVMFGRAAERSMA